MSQIKCIEDSVLIQKLCLALPETTEVEAWGHPTFRVGGKIFVGFGEQAGRRCIGVKVGKERQRELLKDPRYLFSDYVGKYGWVTLTLEHELDWEEIGGLVLTSYRAIAPARIVKQLDGESGDPVEKTARRKKKSVTSNKKLATVMKKKSAKKPMKKKKPREQRG